MQNKMKTVVITGAAGLIGSHLSFRFLLLGWRVLGIDSLIGGYKDNLPLENSNFIFIQKDILDNYEIAKQLKKYSPDLVIHCAALAHEGLSVFSPKTIVENIYSGTASIASAAIAAKVPLFINTTSMARYGNQIPPFSEDMPTKGVDPYGLAKAHAEEHLNLIGSIHGMKVFHIVPHNVCGPHQCYSDPFRNVMSIFANLSLKGKPIYIYGDGKQKRSFSHVKDCVDAFIALYRKRNEVSHGEVFNIGPDNGTEITILDLAHKVSSYCNTEANIKFMPPRPQEVLHAWVSTEKAKKVLNYTTANTCDDTIRDTVNWIRTQPERNFNYHLTIEIVTEKTPKTWTKKLFNA